MKLRTAMQVPLLAVALAVAPAFAANSKALEQADKVLENAKTTLSQAISTAETEVGGKALSARLARWHNQDYYDVRVIKGDQLTNVHIGIEDGKVISTRPAEHPHMAKAKASAPEKTTAPEKTEQSSKNN